MQNDHDSEAVQQFLEQLKLVVQPIEPGHRHKTPTPDLLVEKDGERMLVEVEAKRDDKQLRHLLEADPRKAILYQSGRTRDRIREGWKQIRDYPELTKSDFTLVWFLASARTARVLVARSARAVLYGTEVLEGHTERGEYYSKLCYFFHESFFFSNKDMDFVVIDDQSSINLCSNPFSPRYQIARNGTIFGKLANSMPVLDPHIEEISGTAFIADCEVDRRNTNAVVKYLRDKYSLKRPTITRFPLVNFPAE